MRRTLVLISIGCSIGWLVACSDTATGDAESGEGTTAVTSSMRAVSRPTTAASVIASKLNTCG